MRNPTSDLETPRSDALPLTHRDSMLKGSNQTCLKHDLLNQENEGNN